MSTAYSIDWVAGCFVIGVLTGLVLSYLHAEHVAGQASKQNEDGRF